MAFSENRQRTVCFTGHRDLPPDLEGLEARLEETIRALYARGFRYFGAGGARGFDALASEAVLRLRSALPELRLILVLPFPEQYRQEGNWSPEDLDRYETLLGRADKVVILEEGYSPGVYQRRNRHLVDHAAVCVSYLQRRKSGTGGTVRYARSQGLELLELAPHPFRL